MLNHFKIGTKLFVGFFFSIFLLLVVAGAGYLGLIWLGTTTINDLNRFCDVSNLAVEVEGAAQSAESYTQRYIRSVSEEDYQGLQAGIKTMLEKLQAIESRTKRQVMLDWVNEIRPIEKSYEQASTNIRKTVDTRSDADGARRNTGRDLDDKFDAMSNHLQKAIDRNDDSLPKAERHFAWLLAARMERERAGRLLRDVLIAVTREERDVAEQRRVQAMDKLHKEMQKIIADPLDDGEKELATAVDKVAGQWGSQGEVFTGLMNDLYQYEADCYDAIGKIIGITKKMSASATEAIGTAVTDANNLRALVVEVIVIVAGIAVIVGLVLNFVLIRNVVGGLRHAISATKHMAETGDLTLEISREDLMRGDEVGDLVRSLNMVLAEFKDVAGMANELAAGDWRNIIKHRGDLDVMNRDLNTMLTQVNRTLREIDDGVKQVSTGSGEVSTAANSLSSGAQEAAASLEEITASMSEISSQTKTNAESALQARDLAQKASKAAIDGQEAMQAMTGSMELITKNSNEIQRVIKVIDDIAFQTNLLALNAAVEAARAGQHGKGFAVVAEEVRNLASRSAKAAQETSELIDKSGQEIVKGGEVASRTAGVLNTIVEQIKQTTDLVAGIAVASNEQAEGVNQVTIGLQQIDALTQQNTATAEESASAEHEMSGMASNLQKLVGQFKLR